MRASVSGFTSAGPRMPRPAFHPAQAAKSRTDICATPAGPITGGASAAGPHSIGVMTPRSSTWCPTGASILPVVACGPEPRSLQSKWGEHAADDELLPGDSGRFLNHRAGNQIAEIGVVKGGPRRLLGGVVFPRRNGLQTLGPEVEGKGVGAEIELADFVVVGGNAAR